MIRVGTSNWSQSEIRKSLPPERLAPGAMLAAYSRVFDTVEINSTFYHFHQRKTFLGWKNRTSNIFVFSIKANRLFTHERRLERPGQELDQFISDLCALGPALGPLLFQLPASLHANAGLLSRFLASLKESCERAQFQGRVAFEFRHPSWHIKDIFNILEKAGAGFCIFDISRFTTPPIVTSDFTYIRLHGPLKTPYQGQYGRRALLHWAERVALWNSAGLDCFVYLNNTRFGDAVPDALLLRELVVPSQLVNAA